MKTARIDPEATGRPAVRSVPLWLSALFLGSAALGAWFLIQPALASDRYYSVGYNRNTFEYGLQIALLFVPYFLALRAWRRGSRVPLWVLLSGAVILHILVLFAPLPQSQDFYQYLFYGKMQAAHHANPYLVRPNVFWADGWLPWTGSRWHGQTSVYGPLWMMVTFLVAKAAGDSLSVGFVLLKLVIFAIDVGVMALIVAGGRPNSDPRGRAGWGLLVFAWNPLVLVTVPLAGSVDIVLAACFIGAVLARRRGRPGLATLLLALASLTKVYAIIALVLHLVLVARERGWLRAAQHAGGAVAVAALLYAPYWSGLQTFKGLIVATSLTNVSLTGTVQVLAIPAVHALGFHTPHLTAHVVHLLAGAGLLAVVVWAIRKVRSEPDLWYCLLVVFAAYLYLTPWFLSWYTIGALALVAVLPTNRMTVPIIAFSGTSLAVLWTPQRSVDWLGSSLIRYVPPAAIYVRNRALAWARRRKASGEHGGGPAVPITVPSTTAVPRYEPAAK